MATCKDCIYFAACRFQITEAEIEKRCEIFKDKSRFVELPCKAVDTLWILVDEINVPLEARVRSMVIENNTIDFNCAVKGYYAVTVNSDDFGESFFLTKEEAEAEAKRRK